MSQPILSVIPQRHDSDCAVACLAMVLGLDYETSLIAFSSRKPLTKGVKIRDVQAAARKLGRGLRFTRKVDLETDCGVLSLRSDQWACDHMVVLKEGLIVDTDATLWDADVYMAAYNARILSLLVVVTPA